MYRQNRKDYTAKVRRVTGLSVTPIHTQQTSKYLHCVCFRGQREVDNQDLVNLYKDRFSQKEGVFFPPREGRMSMFK